MYNSFYFRVKIRGVDPLVVTLAVVNLGAHSMTLFIRYTWTDKLG